MGSYVLTTQSRRKSHAALMVGTIFLVVGIAAVAIGIHNKARDTELLKHATLTTASVSNYSADKTHCPGHPLKTCWNIAYTVNYDVDGVPTSGEISQDNTRRGQEFTPDMPATMKIYYDNFNPSAVRLASSIERGFSIWFGIVFILLGAIAITVRIAFWYRFT